MIRTVLACLGFALAAPAAADVPVARIVDEHILPGFEALASEAADLKRASLSSCAPESPGLRAAFANAFDAWISVSHLRFGPTETGDRAFALAFWPDTRGATPAALRELILSEDAAVSDPAEFARVSIAARGFYALEFLLHDPEFAEIGDAGYRCALVQAIATDIAANTGAVLDDWRDSYAELLKTAGSNDTYRSGNEAAQELYKALTAGLRFTSGTRIGRPLGSFDRPRPRRAEAWRSGRSLAHIVLSLEGTRGLALLLADEAPEVKAELDEAYERALQLARELNDPVLAGVADPQGRLRVEILQQAVDTIRQVAGAELGPVLDVSAGFNALDGD